MKREKGVGGRGRWQVADGKVYATESGGDVNEITDSSFLSSFLLFRLYERYARFCVGFSVDAVRVLAYMCVCVCVCLPWPFS